MLDVEVFGAELAPGAPPPHGGDERPPTVPEAPSLAETRRLCALAAAAVGIEDGHLAIEYVDQSRIARLNAEHRGKDGPTDVLSFPIDGAVRPDDGVERELGDVVICPAHTSDLREAIVHGVLHLVGFDHETDDGEMLALQAELLAGESQ
ncbi:MAG TPA: rRNA maturation RNase YbeY [Solirubrobacteraceae bacterium]